MLTQKSSNVILILVLTLALALVGCGNQPATTPQEAAPVPVEQVAPVEEVVVEAVPEAEFDLVAAVDGYLSNIPQAYMTVSLDAFKEVMDTGQAVIIDVREVSEYEAGHIPGAINIPLRSLAQNLRQVPADKPVVVYCMSGHRAGLAVSALHMLGYENSRSFAASYKGWTEANEPIVTELMAGDTYSIPEIEPELLAAVDDFLSTIPEGFLAMGDLEKFNEARDNDAFLVDVREESEYLEGYIPGAVNIPIRTLAQNLDKIPTDQAVFVYCKSGHRAALSTAALHTLGYSNVRTFPPGFDGWVNAGQPIAAAVQ